MAGSLALGPAVAAEPSFKLIPESGSPGSTFSMSSTNACAPATGEVGEDAHVVVALVDEDDEVVGDEKTLDVNPSGGFVGTLKVPADADPGDYTVVAACFADEDADDPFRTLEETFTVTGAGDGTTTTTVKATTTTTAKPPSKDTEKDKAKPAAKAKKPLATAAKPVKAQPRFTG